MKKTLEDGDLSSFPINWALTKNPFFVSLNADKDAVGSNFGYLLPISGAGKSNSPFLKEINPEKRKEVKGSEEEAEFSPGSSVTIRLFLWLWGLQGNEIEMS